MTRRARVTAACLAIAAAIATGLYTQSISEPMSPNQGPRHMAAAMTLNGVSA